MVASVGGFFWFHSSRWVISVIPVAARGWLGAVTSLRSWAIGFSFHAPGWSGTRRRSGRRANGNSFSDDGDNRI